MLFFVGTSLLIIFLIEAPVGPIEGFPGFGLLGGQVESVPSLLPTSEAAGKKAVGFHLGCVVDFVAVIKRNIVRSDGLFAVFQDFTVSRLSKQDHC